MNQPSSLFDRYISRSRSLRARIGFGLALILLPFIAAFLDGNLASFFSRGLWRFTLQAPAVVLYILGIAPIMNRIDASVVQSFRSVVQLDDDSYQELVRRAAHIQPQFEAFAILLGISFGLFSTLTSELSTITPWLKFTLLVTMSMMNGLLIWTIAVVIASTRLTRTLHRQPLCIDIFDTSPFEPIGRQSLAQALVFIGGITLSLVFILTPQNIRLPELWMTYGVFGLAPILVFFLNMRPTNQVLAAEKKRELGIVQGHISRICRDIVQRLSENRTSESLAVQLTALVAYEQRLQAAKTWPYNVGMIRTLFFSFLVPGVTILVRLILNIR